jgi:hypothetical protein
MCKGKKLVDFDICDLGAWTTTGEREGPSDDYRSMAAGGGKHLI